MAKWERVRLGDVCNVLNGFAFQSKEYVSKGHRVIRITNVQKGKVVDDDPKYYNASSNLEKYELFKDDLLMSLTGNVGRVGLISEDLLPAYLNQRVACLRIKDNSINTKYLFRLLDSDTFERNAIASSKGLAQKNMSTEWLKEYGIYLPLIKTQQKIADALDKASSLIEKRKAQIEKLDLLIKSQFIEMFGDPVTNPKGWDIKLVAGCLSEIEAGWSVDGEPRERQCNELAVLKVSAVTKGIFNPKEYKVITGNVEIKKRVSPQKGDLLFSRANTRELVGATCIVSDDYPFLILPDKLWKLRCSDLVQTIYMKYILSHKSIRDEMSSNATGTSGSMYNVSMQKLKNIQITVPPLALQNEFSAFVVKLEVQKSLLQQSLTKLELNYQSLLQKCFRGEIF